MMLARTIMRNVRKVAWQPANKPSPEQVSLALALALALALSLSRALSPSLSLFLFWGSPGRNR